MFLGKLGERGGEGCKYVLSVYTAYIALQNHIHDLSSLHKQRKPIHRKLYRVRRKRIGLQPMK